MNRIFTFVILLATVVFSQSSCSNMLDAAPDGTLTYKQIFSDNDKVAAYLNTCYSFVPAKGIWYYFSTNVPTALSDEGWDADDCVGLRVVQYYDGNCSAGGDPLYEDMPDTNKRMGTYWKYYWTAIRNCGIFLQYIDGATVSKEENRQRWKAEAHVLRAYYYFELLKWYGSAFPVNKDPYELDKDFSDLRPAGYGEIVKFIEADCIAALASDKLPWRITTESEIMRVTKAVAECIRSKALLFAVSPRNSDGTYTLDEAYRVSKESLKNLRDNGYELFNKDNTFVADEVYTDPYKDVVSGPNKQNLLTAIGASKHYFCNWADYSSNPVDKETIWQHQVNQQRMWLITTWFGNYKCGVCPTQEYVDAFEVTDGTEAYPILDLARPYNDEKHLDPNYNPAASKFYKTSDPYKNRDPRFYAGVYYNGSKRYMEETKSWETVWTDVDNKKSGLRDGSSSGDRAYTRTGYYGQKFLHPTESNHDLNQVAPGWKLFRLAEIILNTAELAVESGNPVDAVPLLNEIRKRSGMPDVKPVNSGDLAEMRRLVRQERRVEMGYEECRYYDVRRWLEKGEDKDLRETDRWITKMVIKDVSGSHTGFTYTRASVREKERDCYKSRYLRMPIPLAEASRLEVITGVKWQNPGW